MRSLLIVLSVLAVKLSSQRIHFLFAQAVANMYIVCVSGNLVPSAVGVARSRRVDRHLETGYSVYANQRIFYN